MKKNKVIIISVAMVLAAAGVIFFLDNQPGKNASVQEKVQYLASDDFGRLSNEKKQQYLQKLDTGEPEQDDRQGRDFFESMDQDQQIKLIANMMQAFAPMIEKEIDKFEQLPQAEQDGIINKIADSMVERRKQNPNARGSDSMADISPEMLNALLENTSPRLRAHINNFKKIINQKLAENNLKLIP